MLSHMSDLITDKIPCICICSHRQEEIDLTSQFVDSSLLLVAVVREVNSLDRLFSTEKVLP